MGFNMDLNIVLESEDNRVEIEHFIQKIFMKQYDANITQYLPWLFSIQNKNEEIQGALSLRGAHGSDLFLEQYLDGSIEKIASNIVGVDIFRDDVIEVGNLAVTSKGGARMLIHMLTAFLRGAGYKWVVFTAPKLLINSFKRLNLPLHHLANAKPGSLIDTESDWGSYYDNNPQVVIGNVNEGFELLNKNPNISQVESAMVWNQAYAKGYMYRVKKNNTPPRIAV